MPDKMFEVAEFAKLVKRRNRRLAWAALLPFGIYLLWLFVFRVWIVPSAEFLIPVWPHAAIPLILAIIPVFALVGFVFGIFRNLTRTARKTVIACPDCAGDLQNSEFVIASKCCPHCAKQVIAPPAETVPKNVRNRARNAGQMSVDQFQKTSIRFHHHQLLMIFIPVLIAIVCTGFISHRWAAAFQASELIKTAPFLIALVWMFIWDVVLNRRLGVRCQYCRHKLHDSWRIVSTTDNCPSCGRRALLPQPLERNPVEGV
jgi:uncharacterized integral membrane protein